VALVGAGRRAREGLAPAILQSPGLHLRALWSRSRESAERLNIEVAGCSLEVFHGEEGLAQLLARPDIEACATALPPAVQPRYVARVLAARKHVLSEKPIAPDRKGATEIMKKLEESNEDRLIWFVSDSVKYEPAFHPSQLRLHELGGIVAAELYAVLVAERRADDACGSAVGSDAEAVDAEEPLFVEGGVQHIAVLRRLLGQVTQVNCIRASTSSPRDGATGSSCDDGGGSFWKGSLSGTLRFDSGTLCTVNWHTSDRPQDERFRVTLWGARGSASVELDTGAQAVAAGLRIFALRRAGSGGGQQLPHAIPASGMELQLEAWCSAIRSMEGLSQGEDSEGSSVSTDESPLTAIVDLMVVSAMLQSRGSNVHIRAKSRVAA